jgi:hypothetical protein
MDIFLKKSPNELVENFKTLETPEDIAQLLEIPYDVLIFHLYRVLDLFKYKVFSIRKKSGGKREICAPATRLKIIQKKLSFILKNVYRTKPAVHGFSDNRSILTNAVTHADSANVLNVDLLNFFPSINFGRVRGMFIGKPYNLPKKVATVLAQICCFEGKLPQGAPSSPVVSNMICAKMDSELQRLARKFKCTYTRYADDITISNKRSIFPKALAESTPPKGVTLGEYLVETIKQNGFEINYKKVSLRPRDYRQEVTGLTVNQFPNINIKFTNRLRAMLHAWEKYGLKNAEKEFIENYDKQHRSPFMQNYWSSGSSGSSLFRAVIIGRLNFLRMVRGVKNPTFLKLCAMLNEIDPSFTHIYKNILKEAKKNKFEDSVFVIDTDQNQGTAFMLENIGLVTCFHATGDNMRIIKAYSSSEYTKVSLQKFDSDNDIAILACTSDFSCTPLKKGNSERMKLDDKIKVVGFPNYAPGATIQTYDGKVSGERLWFGYKRIVVDASIICGSSGGPVLNDKNEVIGIAATGKDKPDTYSHEVEFGVIPINAFDKLQNKE